MFYEVPNGLSHGSNKQVVMICDYCGTVFTKRYADAIRQTKHFCNRDCVHKYQHKVAEEKLTAQVGMEFKDWLIEKYVTEQLSPTKIADLLGWNHHHQAVLNWLKCYNIPIRNQSECRTGKLSPNYNPNLTDEERIARRDSSMDWAFKKLVFERDNYTCQKCGKHGGVMNAHHILNYKDYPNERYDVSNGVTLCEACHKKFHRKYGYKHATSEQFLEYMAQI